MKRLLLLRHAKASQELTDGDHGRPLAPRGRSDAVAMGKAIRRAGLLPDAVLCSGARRTRETWALVSPELEADPAVGFSEALYLAPWNAVIALARATADSVHSLMLVGHNPGLEDCAAALLRHDADDTERARRVALVDKFPTGALAVIDCDIADWAKLEPACGALSAFIRPRDLE